VQHAALGESAPTGHALFTFAKLTVLKSVPHVSAGKMCIRQNTSQIARTPSNRHQICRFSEHCDPPWISLEGRCNLLKKTAHEIKSSNKMHRFTNYETRLLSQITHCCLGGGVFIGASRKTHEQVQNKERTNRLTKCQRQADTYCWPLSRSVSGRQLELHSNHSRSDDASCQTIPETSANA
jgi:hypothetical protein